MPKALTALKYFAEDASQYAIVSAGSLLGVALGHQGISFPVGKVDFLRLEPMDFEEFAIALGEKQKIEDIRKSLNNKEPLLFKEELKDAFRQYLAIGGMPEAVDLWIKTKDIKEVDRILVSILSSYKDDFGKYSNPALSNKIEQIWNNIPAQFAKENHKFIYGVVRESARARDYEFVISWLVNSGLAHKVHLCGVGDKLPLSAYQNINDFKLYVVDIAILRVLSKLDSGLVIGADAIWSQFGGAFAEQFVLQQLFSQGLDAQYYWVGGISDESKIKKGRSEVDFLVATKNSIIPIEVKSGENVKAKSLRVFRDKYNPKLSVRFSLKDLQYNEGLLNIPLYMSFLFQDLIEIYSQ
jgi:predicted AAA+ superfamily ATPase